MCKVRAMSNLFEHCRTAAKFAALRSNGERKTVKVSASLQTEPQPSLRHCEAMANEKRSKFLQVCRLNAEAKLVWIMLRRKEDKMP